MYLEECERSLKQYCGRWLCKGEFGGKKDSGENDYDDSIIGRGKRTVLETGPRTDRTKSVGKCGSELLVSLNDAC